MKTRFSKKQAAVINHRLAVIEDSIHGMWFECEDSRPGCTRDEVDQALSILERQLCPYDGTEQARTLDPSAFLELGVITAAGMLLADCFAGSTYLACIEHEVSPLAYSAAERSFDTAFEKVNAIKWPDGRSGVTT